MVKRRDCWINVGALTDNEIWDLCREFYGSRAVALFRRAAATLAYDRGWSATRPTVAPPEAPHD